jgi:hypothetical protein
MPIAVSVHNPTDESVTFKCYGQIEYRNYRALAPRKGCEEMTLAPGDTRNVPMVFTEKDTKGLIPVVYQLKASLSGVSGAGQKIKSADEAFFYLLLTMSISVDIICPS